MPRLHPRDPAQLSGPIRVMLEEVRYDLGFVPVLMRLLAHAPAALAGYIALRASLQTGILPASLREQIAIAVAAANTCNECFASHTRFGREAGLSDEALADAAHARATDPATAAALGFARALIETRGQGVAPMLPGLRAAGFDDTAIIEIAAVVAMNVFANIVNNLGPAASEIAVEACAVA